MKKPIVILTLCSFLFVQNACSVSRALNQPPPADLQGLGVGTSRLEVIQRLGAPMFSETDAEGKKQDSFEFQSGMHGASKSRVIFYLAGDIFTLGGSRIYLLALGAHAFEKRDLQRIGDL